jgi:hypothetical protein
MATHQRHIPARIYLLSEAGSYRRNCLTAAGAIASGVNQIHSFSPNCPRRPIDEMEAINQIKRNTPHSFLVHRRSPNNQMMGTSISSLLATTIVPSFVTFPDYCANDTDVIGVCLFISLKIILRLK